MIAGLSIQIQRQAKPDNPAFSILIPTWNNLDYLKRCVDSIRKNSQFTHQVIIHINENRDGTLEWVKTQPDLDYTFSEKNIGICCALNVARELVSASYIAYMNDDMYVCPGWDKTLKVEIDHIGHPYFFISSTAIEPLDNGNPCVLTDDFGKDINHFDEQRLLKECFVKPMPDWQGSTWPPNVVHRDLWDLAGGYSVEFSPGMYSDPDFSMKLWMLGVRYFKGLGGSRVYHFGSKSTGRIRKNNGYYQFIQKWGISSSTFTKYYLRRGKPFDGALQEPVVPWLVRIKNYWKRFQAIFHHNARG